MCECRGAFTRASKSASGIFSHPFRTKKMSLLTLLLLTWCAVSQVGANSSGESNEFEKNVAADHVVWAIAGSETSLPCDLSVSSEGDAVSMVLWFKDTIGMPLYSLDFREGPLVHWATTDALGARTHFVFEEFHPERAHLSIKGVQIQDEGVFRCRVDYMNSPTKNYRTNLSLIVPPNEPRIFDGKGREIAGVAGPFREEYDLYLSCQVTGGRPPPEVTWWLGTRQLDGIDDTTASAGTVTSQLFIGTVSRDLHTARLQCRALVSHLIPAVVKEIQLQVYLKPLEIHIISPNDLVPAGRPHALRCESIGSHPPARLTWLLDGEVIRSHPVTVSTLGNLTSSIATLILTSSDDGRELTCRASNPWFPGGGLEESRTIHVAFPPKVSISSTDNPTTLKEGGEVQLICNTEARPAVDKYAWFRGNDQLYHNPAEGMIVLGRTMRLRNLTRLDTGNYSCKAENTEGHARSQPLFLNVLYVPLCKLGPTPKEVIAIRHTPLALRCEVDSPEDAGPVKFSWTFNKTRDVLPVPASKAVSSGLVSELSYTPMSSADFGTLACWGTSNAGHQKQPCLFSIVQAKVPEPPRDCLLLNTSMSLEVSCRAGSDGGMPQHFLMELLRHADDEASSSSSSSPLPPYDDAENEISTMNDQGVREQPPPPLYRQAAEAPRFPLRGLLPGKQYAVLVYAANARGRSAPARIKGVTLPEGYVVSAADLTQDSEDKKKPFGVGIFSLPENQSLAMLLGALVAAATLGILLIISAAAVVVCRKRRRPEGEGNGMEMAKRQSAGGPSMYGTDDDNGFGLHFGTPNVMIRPCADIRRDSRRTSRVLSALSALREDALAAQELTPIQQDDGEELEQGPINVHLDPNLISPRLSEPNVLRIVNIHPQDMTVYSQLLGLKPESPIYQDLSINPPMLGLSHQDFLYASQGLGSQGSGSFYQESGMNSPRMRGSPQMFGMNQQGVNPEGRLSPQVMGANTYRYLVNPQGLELSSQSLAASSQGSIINSQSLEGDTNNQRTNLVGTPTNSQSRGVRTDSMRSMSDRISDARAQFLNTDYKPLIVAPELLHPSLKPPGGDQKMIQREYPSLRRNSSLNQNSLDPLKSAESLRVGLGAERIRNAGVNTQAQASAFARILENSGYNKPSLNSAAKRDVSKGDAGAVVRFDLNQPDLIISQQNPDSENSSSKPQQGDISNLPTS